MFLEDLQALPAENARLHMPFDLFILAPVYK
jgi:hypothetical protein